MNEAKDFDKVYRYYDGFMDFFKLYKLEEIKVVADINREAVVVDIGGGTGKLAEYIHNDCKTVYILDESEKMLSKVKKEENILCIRGNALSTPFEDHSVDRVILSDVFHHIKEQKALIAEVNRILKVGGKVILLDFHKNHIKTKCLMFFEFLLFGRLFFRTKEEIRDLLEDYFFIQKVYDKGYYFTLVGEKNDK